MLRVPPDVPMRDAIFAETFHGFALTLLIPSLSAPRTRSETRYKKNGRTIPQLSEANGGKNIEESGQSCRQTTKLRKEAPTMISVDGDTMMRAKPRHAASGPVRASGRWVRLPGRSMWKRIQSRPGLNHLTKPERDALVCSLRLASTEQ